MVGIQCVEVVEVVEVIWKHYPPHNIQHDDTPKFYHHISPQLIVTIYHPYPPHPPQ